MALVMGLFKMRMAMFCNDSELEGVSFSSLDR